MSNSKTDLPLENALRSLLGKRRQNSTLRTLTLPSPNQIDFSSNDFLSLSTSSLLKSAFLSEISSTKLPLGSGGSRLLDGNSTYAETVESEIAAFHGAEAGLLFNSGYDANAGFFACVPQKGDVVVYDELIHASVHDGMRLSRAGKCLAFRHNCVTDLRRLLNECLQSSKDLREGKSHVFIAVEAVYSMDGDLAPLKAIIETVEDVLPNGCGYVVVDEAHATGVLGPNGRGLVCSLGLERKIFARLHTFGKALACNGGELLLPPFVISRILCLHWNSNYTRAAHIARLSHQLCPSTDIHHVHVVHQSGCYPSVILAPAAREDGRSETFLPKLCALSNCIQACCSPALTYPDAFHRAAVKAHERLQRIIESSVHMSRVAYILGSDRRAKTTCKVSAAKRYDGSGCSPAYSTRGDGKGENMSARREYGI
jgi:hypothetical protein